MEQVYNFTEKSKNSLLKALAMAQNCSFKYVEPQVLMAGIVNEGHDMLSYIFQYLQVDRIAFCNEISVSISNIDEFSQEEPHLGVQTLQILETAKSLSVADLCELVPIEYIFLAMIIVPSSVKDVFTSFGIEEDDLFDAVRRYRGNSDLNTNRVLEISEQNSSNPNLDKYARNLCSEARNGSIPNAIGRDDEIRRIIHILARQTKNNPILVGEPGTGKTAIVEGLAHRIISDDVPRELRSVKIYSLDVGALIAGAGVVGEFEERLKGVLEEVASSDGNIILFIDEIHLLIGEGRTSGAMDAANIMKPELARGRIKVIGATTFEEFKKYIERDKAFERRFQKVLVQEPEEDAALAIIRGVRIRLENFHKIRIKDEAVRAAVKLSSRYIQERFLPDKAIDLLDEAASRMKIARSSSPTQLDSLRRKITTKEIECESLRRDDESNPVISALQEEITNLKEELNSLNAKWQSERQLLDKIQICRNQISQLKEDKQNAENQGAVASAVNITAEIKHKDEEISHLTESLHDDSGEIMLKPELDEMDVMTVITEWTGIPVSKLSEAETQKLSHIEEYLNNTVVGQDEAKIAVANAIRRSRFGFSDANKPIGSFLFLGTTGVGKTELCKALSEYLFDSRDALIRIDMSEYQQEHEVAKLFGAPPGYLGFEEGGQLTEAVRRKPYSVVLFDEIEKAHPKVFETLLQVLDDGRMTDGKGRTVSFKNTIIVMTSNLGHQVIYSTLQGHHVRQRPHIGFTISEQQEPIAEESVNIVTDAKIEKAKSLILSELKSKVAPEFINRIDDIVMFLPLSKDDVRKIVGLQVASLKNKMLEQGFKLQIDDSAIEFLAAVGFQPEFGARPVKRAINSYLVDDLCQHIISADITKDKIIEIKAERDKLEFTNIN